MGTNFYMMSKGKDEGDIDYHIGKASSCEIHGYTFSWHLEESRGLPGESPESIEEWEEVLEEGSIGGIRFLIEDEYKKVYTTEEFYKRIGKNYKYIVGYFC